MGDAKSAAEDCIALLQAIVDEPPIDDVTVCPWCNPEGVRGGRDGWSLTTCTAREHDHERTLDRCRMLPENHMETCNWRLAVEALARYRSAQGKGKP